jgi:hypothetical protein
MRDILGIAVAVLVGLLTLAFQPWTPPWWGGVIISGSVAAGTAVHIVWRNLPAGIRPLGLRIENIKSKIPTIVASIGLTALFFGLLGYAVTHTPVIAPDAPDFIADDPPVFVPHSTIPPAPPGQRPLLSSAANFIFSCYFPKQTSAETAKRKAFLQRSLKPWGEEVGFDISMTDVNGGLRVTIEPKTEEAKSRFLRLGVLPVVATVFIDVQKFGPQFTVVAHADLPKEYQHFSLITPNASAPQIIDAQKHIGDLLGGSEDACHLI